MLSQSYYNGPMYNYNIVIKGCGIIHIAYRATALAIVIKLAGTPRLLKANQYAELVFTWGTGRNSPKVSPHFPVLKISPSPAMRRGITINTPRSCCSG
jgi:hypothetical protein